MKKQTIIILVFITIFFSNCEPHTVNNDSKPSLGSNSQGPESVIPTFTLNMVGSVQSEPVSTIIPSSPTIEKEPSSDVNGLNSAVYKRSIEYPLGRQDIQGFRQLHMTDSQHGFACSFVWGLGSVLLETNDGGRSWKNITPGSIVPNNFNLIGLDSAGFWDKRYIWLVDTSLTLAQTNQVVVYYSSDGGVTFKQSEPISINGNNHYVWVHQIHFIDAENGWILTSQNEAGKTSNYLFRTKDGGNKWSLIFQRVNDSDSGLNCPGDEVLFSDQDNGFMLPRCEVWNKDKFIYYTNNGGESWKRINLPEPKEDPGLFGDTEYNCSVDQVQNGSNHIVHVNLTCTKKIDKLYTFKYLSFSYTLSDTGEVSDYFSYPGYDLFYINRNEAISAGVPWKITHDGGKSWVNTLFEGGSAEIFEPVDSKNYFAVLCDGVDCSLFHSVDSGYHWEVVL
jgi:photosystem II stability/assembly factor-like uncharacterized protein